MQDKFIVENKSGRIVDVTQQGKTKKDGTPYKIHELIIDVDGHDENGKSISSKLALHAYSDGKMRFWDEKFSKLWTLWNQGLVGEVDVVFSLKSQEYSGSYFNDFMIRKVEVIQNGGVRNLEEAFEDAKPKQEEIDFDGRGDFEPTDDLPF